MKTIIKFWIAVILFSLGLLIVQPAHAFNLQSCHLLDTSSHRPADVSDYLPRANLEQLKRAFMSEVLEPSESEVRNYLKSSLIQSKISRLKRSISSDPFNVAAWNNLGHEFYSLERYSDALAAYNHALMINPKYSLGLANKCGVLSKLGQYVQALSSCDLAILGDGHWGMQGPELAWDNRGNVLFNLDRYPESLRSFERALAINSDYKNAQLNRIVVLERLKKNIHGDFSYHHV